jgi:hypothetical protein
MTIRPAARAVGLHHQGDPMFRKTAISSAVLAALALPSAGQAIDVSTQLKNETSFYSRSGQVTGAATGMLDDRNSHDSGDVLKFENSARFFINGDLGENTIWHADLNFIYDTEAVKSDAFDYRGYEPFSQHDYLRELYLETDAGGWDFKLGKQQIVWGTADGIKLLDVINPTDYRELNQNAMEDSRIPIWMAKVERELDANKGNVQFVLSQSQANVIPGLNDDGDAGHPFIMQGVDAITGQVNGFVNITPALGGTAQSFNNAAQAGFLGPASPAGLLPFGGLTVDGFANNPDPLGFGIPGDELLNGITQCGLGLYTTGDCTPGTDPNANYFVTNLLPINGDQPSDINWRPEQRTSAFEHMPNASYATFNTFAGQGIAGGSARTRYVVDHPSSSNPNFGMRFRQTTAGGLGYSLNYLYNYNPNPSVDLSWHDTQTGERLTVQRAASVNPEGFPPEALVPDLTTDRSRADIPRDLRGSVDTTNILLRNAAGQYYGAADPTFGMVPDAHNTNPVELRFTEELNRTHNVGASFDYGLDTQTLGPVVLRGEFLYQRDVKQPVVDNLLLGIGDLSNGLKMEDTDIFSYVLGADITVLTNLLISGQFIQYRNLDYVNQRDTCFTQTGVQFDCSRYTADFATMNPTNGLRRAEKNKEFYSLFFSKPFGPSQRGRWNNITIYEEGGGWWNRFDFEWSLTNQLLGSAEWNHYWGDRETTFGQFAKSSNIQVGLKYFFQ